MPERDRSRISGKSGQGSMERDERGRFTEESSDRSSTGAGTDRDERGRFTEESSDRSRADERSSGRSSTGNQHTGRKK
jgi:hypothetical protein